MSRKIPSVSEWMTRLPMELEHDHPVSRAIKLIEKSRFRHIPVMKGARLFGIVSQRDIVEARSRFGEALDSMPVGEICSQEVLTVSRTSPITDAVLGMIERRVGSALIVDGDVTVGIFTTTDALRALCNVYGRPVQKAP